MRKKIALTLVAALVAASVCACSSGTPPQGTETQAEASQEQEKPPQEQEAAQEPEEAQETDTQEPAEGSAGTAEAPENEVSAQRPTFTLVRHTLMEEKDLSLIAGGSYETVQLTEEAAIEYSSLNKFLEEENEQITLRYEASFEELREAANSALETFDEDREVFPVGEMESRIEAVRCDGAVLSMLETSYFFFPGSAHGMTGYTGYNYDAASGEPLTLEDVIADKDALIPAISENLKVQYDGSEVTDVEEELKFAVEESYDRLAWVLDRDGITFYFAPSDVAPYALGTLEAGIPFAGYPGLFTDRCSAAEGSFARALKSYSRITADLNGDGKEEAVTACGMYGNEEETGDYTGIVVTVGDQSCTVQEDCFDVDSYLLHTEDGRNYIYTVTTSDGDYHRLTVFEIRDGIPSVAGVMEDTDFATAYHEIDGEILSQIFPIIDPESFALYSGEEEAYHYYQVGSDGMPVLSDADTQ